jgi:gluconolactonase
VLFRSFGTYAFYEGIKTQAELPHTHVYRVDGQTGEITLVADDIDHPNGLAFSPDESILYVIESRSDPRNILAYDVAGGTRLTNRRVFYRCLPGETPDGFRVDIDGNLWCGWGMTPEYDGVHVLNSAGTPIGHIHLPERCANLCFGGRNRNRLFMAAAQSLFALYVNTQGVAGG